MNNQQAETVITEKELLTNMIIAEWNVQNKRFADFLSKISDEELAAECSPGRNTGTYLLGHLTAVSDGMLKLMGLRDELYPDMRDVFITSPDNSGKEMPPISVLRERYATVTSTLHEYFSKMTPEEWLGRHMNVSPEDFATQPHRNKLNIVISRTTHFNGHFYQMLYLKKK